MRPRAETALLERRRSVRRAQGRRRRTVALVLLATAALLAGGWWTLNGPPVEVASVRVVGYDRPDRAQLERYLRYAVDGGTVVDPPVRRIEDAVAYWPWVESVTVKRDWPRGLVVSVVQARPAAVVRSVSGPGVLVSGEGRVLGPAPEEGAYARVRIAGALPPVGGRLTPADARTVEFTAALPEDVAGRVRALHARGGALVGQLAQGPELRLGPPERLDQKAQVLAAVLNQLSARDELGAAYIDLSLPERPALGPRAAAEEDEARVEG